MNDDEKRLKEIGADIWGNDNYVEVERIKLIEKPKVQEVKEPEKTELLPKKENKKKKNNKYPKLCMKDDGYEDF